MHRTAPAVYSIVRPTNRAPSSVLSSTDSPAVGVGDVTHDGRTETGAAVPREPVFEHLLALRLGDTTPVVHPPSEQ